VWVVGVLVGVDKSGMCVPWQTKTPNALRLLQAACSRRIIAVPTTQVAARRHATIQAISYSDNPLRMLKGTDHAQRTAYMLALHCIHARTLIACMQDRINCVGAI